jgi:hypothetical protein
MFNGFLTQDECHAYVEWGRPKAMNMLGGFGIVMGVNKRPRISPLLTAERVVASVSFDPG